LTEKEIKALYLNAVTFLPNSAEDFNSRGVANYNKNNYDQAIADYNKALKLNPKYVEAYNNRGNAYGNKRDYDRAIADYNKTLELNPNCAEAYYFRGIANHNKRDYARAIADYGKAIQLKPDYAAPYEKRKIIYREQDEAKKQEEKKKKEEADLIALVILVMVISGTMVFLIKWTSRNGKAKTSREQNVVLKPSLDKDQQLPAETRGYDSSSPLVREGRHNEALEAILRKPQDKITLPDYNFLFETYVQLGDFIRAGLILSTITRIIAGKHPVERFQGRLVLKENRARAGNPPAGSLHDTYLALARMVRGKEHADWAAQLSQLAVDCLVTTLSIRDNPRAYYDLALAFEKDGENSSALELYQIFDETGRHYFDVAERYKKLKTRIKDGPAHPAKPPQAREFAPAQAAFKTGVAVAGVVLNSRYELRAQLGEGGMGVIYEGLDRQTGQPVAVKRMHTYLKEYPEEYARFRREAQIVGQLRHPNIIRIHELLEQAGEIYLVFEYVSGKTLQDFLKEKKRFQLEECKNIFNGVCVFRPNSAGIPKQIGHHSNPNRPPFRSKSATP